MSKIAVVYWSGTGNTEAMAKAVLEGAKEKGAEVVLLTPDEFDVSMMDSYDAIAFGCPAMGAEVLEEEEFEPMFASCESKLSGKRIALFGSYGWGKEAGAVLICESVICNEMPDDEGIQSCKALGENLD